MLEFRAVPAGSPPASDLLAALVAETGAGRPAPDTDVLVGYDRGRPVCCGAVVATGDDEGALESLFVAPEARGNGADQALLDALEDTARGRGLAMVRIAEGPAAGFAEAGVLEAAGWVAAVSRLLGRGGRVALKRVTTIDRIATERLDGERILPGHWPELHALYSHPDVARWLFPPPSRPRTEEQSRDLARRHARHWHDEGFGLWVFFERATGAPVARGGLMRQPGQGGAIEVGWTVHPDRWGQGIATELGAAAVDVAFGRLGMPSLISLALPDNVASRRVMEKLGFRVEAETVHAGLPHIRHRLDAS